MCLKTANLSVAKWRPESVLPHRNLRRFRLLSARGAGDVAFHANAPLFLRWITVKFSRYVRQIFLGFPVGSERMICRKVTFCIHFSSIRLSEYECAPRSNDRVLWMFWYASFTLWCGLRGQWWKCALELSGPSLWRCDVLLVTFILWAFLSHVGNYRMLRLMIASSSVLKLRNNHPT